MSARMGLAADYSARQDVRGKAEVTAAQAVAMQVASFVRADCAVQTQVLQKLIAQERISVDGDGLEGEYDDSAASAESDYDSEVEFVDDDERREDDQSFAARVARSGEEESPLDSLPCVHEVKIVRRGPGEWFCVPPRNPAQGYRPNGFDAEAQLILDAVHRQFAFYEAVATWLQREGDEVDEVLESPAEFKRRHQPMTRKEFCKTVFCKEVGFTNKDEPNIHAYCKNCRLSWGHASLPLSSVFTE